MSYLQNTRYSNVSFASIRTSLIIFTPIVPSAYIVRALDALPLGRLSKQRMLALHELVNGPLGVAPRARALLLPHLAATTRALLRDKAEVIIPHIQAKLHECSMIGVLMNDTQFEMSCCLCLSEVV